MANTASGIAMKLFDSAFSPFARKVHLVLEYKALPFESVDGLVKENHDELRQVNGRVEVPVLVDEGITVVNSSDIVDYLEFRYPEKPVYPATAEGRVKARAWERTSDTFVDSILVDISYWGWANRPDTMPDGLLDAARADLAPIYAALDRDLDGNDFICGDISIADFALFPHIGSVKALDVPFSPQDHPNIARWFSAMCDMPICVADLRRTLDYVTRVGETNVELDRIFWRGDRIEWILAKGYHDWFFGEIEAGRVMWPGPAVPAPIG